MKYVVAILLVFAFSGCSNTWQGVKEDSSNAGKWTKEKVRNGAEWVSEKTN